ncbi:hypothetical protein AeMF1_017078 [Aphanomyces euteiches]|nr:hypothetical protein AeMF1_017078 [Aphanomyces euteiches]KAH9184899.1 hypothetical protein AeNC1_013126 [Aphanomyces euteiches]
MGTDVSSLVHQTPPLTYAVVATTAGAILFGTLVLHCLWKSSRLRHVPTPPATSFLFGHLYEMCVRVVKWKSDDHYPEPYLSWGRHPVALQHILVANANNYPRLPMIQAYLRNVTMGDGLLSVEGKQHDSFRKVMNPLFAVSKIKTFLEIFNNQTQLYSQNYLESACDTNTPVDLLKMFARLMQSIVGLTVLGYDFDKSPVALKAYEQSMIEPSPLMLIGTFFIPGFLNLPIPSLAKRRKAQDTLKTILVEVIQDKLATMSPENPQDLLDMILPHATTQEAVSHTLTFMMAGHDTSSNTLGFIFGILPTYPKIIAAIRAEYYDVISKYGSLNSWEAVSELTYTQAAIQEAMRLNTVIFSMIHRTAVENDNVPMSDGSIIFMPKGTTMQTNLASIHRNPKYWTNPDSFIPDRFVEGTPEWDADLALRGGKSHAFHYMPFSFGSKSCIGQRFAMAEMQVVVATLFSKYEITPTSKTDMRHVFGGIALKLVNVEMSLRRVPAPGA